MYFLLTIVLTSSLQVIQNTFKLDEMFNICSNQLDDERKKRATDVQTLSQSEQDLADARKKLLAEEQARKSANLALEGYQKQAEGEPLALGKCRTEEGSRTNCSP